MKEWEIQQRSEICCKCQKPFQDNDDVQCHLIVPQEVDGEIRRKDYCIDCWSSDTFGGDNLLYWKGKVKIKEKIEKQKPVKEELVIPVLKNLLESADPLHCKSCYVLLIMLERKKIMLHRDSFLKDDKSYLVYENIKTGESVVVEDPHINLAQVEKVQEEVKGILDEEFAKAEVAWVPENE